MQYCTTTASDGCTLAFQSSLPIPSLPATSTSASHGSQNNNNNNNSPSYKRCIVLMHGFSGSSDYFTRNFAALARHHWVVAPDMRGHGRSGRSTGGYHVARLAADLRSLSQFLVRETSAARKDASLPEGQRQLGSSSSGIQFVPVGCSIGAAVLWTYAELFGHGIHDADSSSSSSSSLAGYIFVDQAPLQDRVPSFLGEEITWDESKAHTGCYDEASTHAAQTAWVHDTRNAHVGLATECLGYRFRPESARPETPVTPEQSRTDEAFFTGISALCDPVWLARLLADHTRYDHRDAIREVVSQRPVLVMAGGLSGCFPRAGLLETAKIVNDVKAGGAEVSVFEDAGHWLFYEQPEKFGKEVARFVDRVTKV